MNPVTESPETPIASPEAFPVLTKEQIDRACGGATARSFRAGEILIEPGQRPPGVFVVLEGQLEITRQWDRSPTLISRLEAGQFTGECGTLIGRPAIARITAITPTNTILIERE